MAGMHTEEEKQAGLQLLLEKQLKHEYLWHDLQMHYQGVIAVEGKVPPFTVKIGGRPYEVRRVEVSEYRLIPTEEK